VNRSGESQTRALSLQHCRWFRLTLLMKCEGLEPGQLARRSVPPSTMSLLGLATSTQPA
jgi:Protein of unknown function (DUF664)